MDLKKLMEGNQNIVIIIPNEHCQETLVEIARDVAARNENICYVNMNKPTSAIISIFEKEGIETKKFYFIDCISKTITQKEEELKKIKTRRVAFIDSPHSLTQLSLEIFRGLETEKIETIIFDSISTLLIYNEEKEVLKFLHHAMSKIRGTKAKAIYPYLKEDTHPKLVKEIALFSDKIIDLGEIKLPKHPEETGEKRKVRLDDFEEIVLK